jgi:Na+/H+ antiporter NhaD/arsenite permease-like protein
MFRRKRDYHRSVRNVVTTGIMEKAGYKVTFYQFMKQAAPITIIALILSSVFLLIRY